MDRVAAARAWGARQRDRLDLWPSRAPASARARSPGSAGEASAWPSPERAPPARGFGRRRGRRQRRRRGRRMTTYVGIVRSGDQETLAGIAREQGWILHGTLPWRF